MNKLTLPTLPTNNHDRTGMLQAGLDLLDQGLTVFDADLRLVAWNAPFLRLLEFPAEMAYVGAPFESFIRYNADHGEYGPGDADQQVRQRVAAATQFSSHTTERVRPNGRVLLVRGEPLPDKGFVTLYTDITLQRQIEGHIQHQNTALEARVLLRTAELERVNASLLQANQDNAQVAAALRRSESRLRLINDNMPVLIGYVDRHETYQYVNKGYCDWFDMAPEAVIGSPVAAVVGDAVYAQVRDHIRQALAGQRMTYEYQRQSQGQTCFARSTMVPEHGPDQEVLGFFVLSQDITRQKQLQTSLIQAQKLEAVGQLTGGLAHDFNNLLTVIIGTLVALKERQPQAMEVSEYIDPALQSARRGAQLIKRLLTFSRQQPLEPMVVEIGALITEVSTLVRRSLPESILLLTDIASDPIRCMVDPGQLESALLNFTLNARDAMPEGGKLRVCVSSVMLNAENGAGSFDVMPGAYAMIDISDDGCGMNQATLERACEPFFTTKRVGMGSGLGLSMAHNLARQSGGGIDLQSIIGRGTQVRLVLPLTRFAAGPVAAAAPVPDQRAVRDRGALILLVEDQPAVRRVVRQQLVALDYLVIEAEDAIQAMSMLAQITDIAIVLSDINIAGDIDGRALGQKITTAHPQVRILLMSGHGEATDAQPAAGLRLVAKPFTRQQLAQALLATRPESR